MDSAKHFRTTLVPGRKARSGWLKQLIGDMDIAERRKARRVGGKRNFPQYYMQNSDSRFLVTSLAPAAHNIPLIRKLLPDLNTESELKPMLVTTAEHYSEKVPTTTLICQKDHPQNQPRNLELYRFSSHRINYIKTAINWPFLFLI